MIRSAPYKEYEHCRQRLSEQRVNILLAPLEDVIHGMRLRRCRFNRGRLRLGRGSLHRTKHARQWRCLLRIKARIGHAVK